MYINVRLIMSEVHDCKLNDSKIWFKGLHSERWHNVRLMYILLLRKCMREQDRPFNSWRQNTFLTREIEELLSEKFKKGMGSCCIECRDLETLKSRSGPINEQSLIFRDERCEEYIGMASESGK